MNLVNILDESICIFILRSFLLNVHIYIIYVSCLLYFDLSRFFQNSIQITCIVLKLITMSFSQKLNAMQQLELDDWLIRKGLQLNKQNYRDLSSVSTVAGLIKNVCPKLVDKKNYMSNTSSLSKLDNWEIFNLKVLRRMGVGLTYSELRNVVHGKLNSLKLLLHSLMHLERDKINPKRKEITHEVKRLTRKERQVPYTRYEDLVLEMQNKDKYICSISHKLRYLESLLFVKEELINKLTQQLQTLINQIDGN